jgi:hypothetical protein
MNKHSFSIFSRAHCCNLILEMYMAIKSRIAICDLRFENQSACDIPSESFQKYLIFSFIIDTKFEIQH